MRVVRVFGGAEAVDHETIDDGEESDDGERSSSGSSSSSSSSSDSSSSGSSSSESEGEEREETGQLPANMPRTDGVASSALDGEGSVPAEDNGDGQQGDSPEVLPQDTEDVEMRSNDGRSRSRDPSSERELAVDSGGEEKASDAEMKSASGSGSGSSSESGSGSSSEDEKDRGSEEKSKPAEVENRDEANIQVEQSQPAEEKRKSRSSSSGSGSSSSSSPSSEDEGGKKGEEGDQKEVTAKDLFGADASDDSGSSSGSLKEKKKKRRRIRSESGSSRGSDKNKGASTLPAEVSVKDILGDLTSDEDDVQVLDEMKSPKRGDSEDEEFRKSPIRGDDFYEGRVTEDMAREGDEVVAVEEPPEPPPEARIEAEIPRISADLGKGFFFVRFPNFLSVDPKPFDGEHYEDEIDEEETQDEEGRARLKLKVENTIRWRFGYDAEQNTVKESNAKIVKWSDGSMSLYLGSEIFDVYKQPLHNDYNHLFVRQGTGLMGQAVFKSKLSFRPHSTDSFTHRKITLSLADRSQKTQKIKVISEVGVNPDVNRWERIKKEEEKLRFATRIQQKVRRVKEKASGKGLTAGFLEGTVGKDGMDEDEEGVSLTAIKNKYKSQVKAIRQSIYSSDSDSDVDKPKQRKQKRAVSDSDDEEGGKKEKGAKSESGSGSDSDASKASKSSKVSKASKVSKGSGAGSKKSGSGSGSGSGSSSSGSGSGSGSGSSSGSDDEGKGGAKGSGSGSE